MALSFDKYQKRKLISSYFSVVISITLVLFLLGCLGILVINTKRISDNFKENLVMNVYLTDEAKDIEIKQLQKTLALENYTKKVIYVTKEEAAEVMKTELGEDYLDTVGYNPLSNSLDIYFNADFVNGNQLQLIKEELIARGYVEDVLYQKDLVLLMNNNIKKITFWTLVICAVFTLIAVLLINSSIRLAVYSKRFIIKTMQMVGATKKFIRKPFILKNIQLGILGAILAIIGMVFVLYYLDKSFPELQFLQNQLLIGLLFLGIFILGIFITLISTFIATQRFLNLKTDQLYY